MLFIKYYCIETTTFKKYWFTVYNRYIIHFSLFGLGGLFDFNQHIQIPLPFLSNIINNIHLLMIATYPTLVIMDVI